jgi:hypothetical protein
MKMVACEIGRAGGQPMDAARLLQEFESTVDLNRLHLRAPLSFSAIS